MRKYISILLPAVFFAAVLPLNVFASISEYDARLSLLPAGTPRFNNVQKLELNYKLWDDKGIVVYGTTGDVSGTNKFDPRTQYYDAGNNRIIKDNEGYYTDDTGRRGEYRYHGYDVNGNKFSNMDFVDDANSGRPVDQKIWLYRPWQNNLMETSIRESDYNYAADYDSNTDMQIMINSTLNGIGTITKGLSARNTPCTAAEVNEFYNFIHVMSPPTTRSPGEGRMWQQVQSDKSIWYQTFSIPTVTKKKNAVTVEIKAEPEISELEFASNAPAEHDDDTEEVRLKVTAALEDADIYNDNIRRATNYSRYDIDHWVITLKGNGNEPITMIGQPSGKDNIGYAEFVRKFKISELKTFAQHGYTFIADAYAVYNDSKNSFSGENTLSIGIRDVPIPEAKKVEPPPTPPPVIVDPKPNIVHPWYDIVPYPASDGTDMDTVDTREVYINGEQVDDDLFFSGNYVFGDGNGGLKRIDVYYTSIDNYPSEYTRWVYIYPTKPRAQFSFTGTYKQNRKMALQETSNSANDAFVLNAYPINGYEWSFKTVDGDGSSRKMRDVSEVYKELMYKTPGTYRIELVVTNTLGRRSDPYVLTFRILEDIPAAVICNLDNCAVGRNEPVTAYTYDAVSTDGDTVASNKLELYYDSDNDGTYDQLLQTWTNFAQFPSYTPAKLGKYKFVNTVKEEFGQETLGEFITDADKKVKVLERELLVDNYIPMTGLYVDIPVVRPQVDMYIMMDKDLNSSKVSYITTNRINIENSLRYNNILPKVENWDMHTYIYSQPASTSSNTGTSYPSDTVSYSSNGYSGTLYRTSVSDNGSNHDYGHTESRTESKTASASASQNGTFCPACGGTPANHGSTYSYSDGDGYSGTLYQTNYSYSSHATSSKCSKHPNVNLESFTRSWSYSGTVTRTVTVWVPNWVWVPNYTGFYSGTIYKSVRQPYTNPFRETSYKYVVYVSDGNIGELNDLKTVMSKSDAKLILIGQDSIKSQISYDYFILNNKPIDQLIQAAVNYISENNTAIEKYLVVAGQDTFTMSTSDYDEENDPIIEKKVQYVQDAGYFDNSTGMESFAWTELSDTNWIDTIVNKFNKVGKFTIYRRIKDRPSTDPNFADYSRYSGIPELQVYAHRKPIALADLDWDYNAAKGVYLTTWVDKSYDLDHQFSREDKGIVDRKIMFRKNGGEWMYYIPAELVPPAPGLTDTYELNYYVKDVEGAWSAPYTMTKYISGTVPMQFKADLRTLDSTFSLAGIPGSEYLEAFDIWTRYPYDVRLELALYKGTDMAAPLKAVNSGSETGSKAGNDITWNSISYQIPLTAEVPDGPYTFRISAVDVNNPAVRSDRSFAVAVRTPINLEPAMPVEIITGDTCEIKASTSKYAASVQVTLFKGTTHETLVDMRGMPDLIGKSWIADWDVPLDIPDGDYLAEFRAITPNGNVEIKAANFNVQSLKITSVTIEGYWNHWRGQTDMFGKQLSNEPHRFLSFETVKINVHTTGFADRVIVRFCPELEAMYFTDAYNNTYDYAEYFNRHVIFPDDSTFTLDESVRDGHVYWEYSLPLAPSTLSWNDERLDARYFMTVTACKGNKSVTYTVDDIDITGNVYDLTYIQPIN